MASIHFIFINKNHYIDKCTWNQLVMKFKSSNYLLDININKIMNDWDISEVLKDLNNFLLIQLSNFLQSAAAVYRTDLQTKYIDEIQL
ncbi:hypothetical protein P5673_004418 [Acropora cervicornis]|uniref:Uncharacterized protein n=1 Tax=Acropora cervicornis TaxID=6130 RepID=A0AAD9R085_ACRCE|nr:hypothetical protein P5673_004418 [Acropora cervicornis]